MGKLPSFQFYPADWQGDLNLQSCSIAARGLWIEMLCLMHRAEPYGQLIINGVSPEDSSIARLVHLDLKTYRRLLDELLRKGVARKSETGVIFCKRMLEDQKLREIRRACGSLGGNPKLVNQKVNQTQNQNPTPSSSTSSSPLEKLNNSGPPKSAVPRLISFFLDECFKRKGFQPVISHEKEGALLKTLLKNHSESELENLVIWFLESPESERLSPSLGVCLSANIFNKWKSQTSSVTGKKTFDAAGRELKPLLDMGVGRKNLDGSAEIYRGDGDLKTQPSRSI